MSVREHISLLALQELLRRRLEEAVPLPMWVAAEIGELRVNHISGHCYMELVEKGGDNGVPRARVNAVVWRGTWGALQHYFASATGADLGVGMRVLMRVTVTYHELYGLSLIVADIDPLYTVGELQMQRQQTIARLRQEGIFDMNRSLGLPFVVQKIAVVSSAGAAGYQDFMSELSASGYSFHTELFDATMQGHGAEESIVEALERVADGEYDVVVMIRGGGAQSDLAVFDSYRLASHIAQFPLPVVAGIGHERDQSIVDMVSAVSLKTPTAVAGWLISGLATIDERLDGFGILLRERTTAALQRARAHLDMLLRLTDSRRPDAILALGFAIVRREGVAVTDASVVHPGDTLEIEFARGKTTVKK